MTKSEVCSKIYPEYFFNNSEGMENQMKQKLLYANDRAKDNYVSPTVDIVALNGDILTESHFDPNMGEWDTE